MEIVIHSLGMPFNGETIAKRSLGGSESAAYYQAVELAKRGHRVTVFSTISLQEQGEWDGVRYCSAGEVTQEAPLGSLFTFYAQHTPHDVLIIQRHPMAFHWRWNSKINILQLHDLALFRSAGMVNHGMWQVDYVTCVSEWHKKQVSEVYGLDPDFVSVVPNGVDPALYVAEADWSGKENLWENIQRAAESGETFNMLYQSRPERGLEHLLRPGGIMDRLKDTKATLWYCGYDNTVPQMVNFYDQLNSWGEALPNVVNIGALTKAQLASVQKVSDLLIYPTEFEEVSCITAMEAMHAGLPLLTSECAALPETCKDSGTFLIPLKDGQADEDGFVSAVRGFLSGAGPKDSKEKQLEAAKTRTWVNAVDVLESAIEAAFNRRRGSAARDLRHMIDHSDAMLAQDREMVYAPSEPNAIADAARNELVTKYAFANSTEAYKEHYDKHQSRYYDDHEDKVIGEDVTGSTRFRGVAGLIANEAAKKPSFRMLDYGCAHGHYLIPIAKAYPGSRFTGIDISERAIAAATKWMVRDNVSNVQLYQGNQDLLRDLNRLCPFKLPALGEDAWNVDPTTGNAVRNVLNRESQRDLFDIILAGEVLEHVADPFMLLSALRDLLKPDGLLIITTPTGKWEWTGRSEFRKAREHLWHFEKQDIRDICGKNDVQILCAPASHDITGEALGSWVWGVRPVYPFGGIDMRRKFEQLAPRETVSACLIVKDGESTLRKCLLSFIDYVDEIIVAIDPDTKDNTNGVLQEIIKEYPLVPIKSLSGVVAMREGFAAARNLTLDHACGDWVLWVDADEEISQPWEMWKYLRPSQHRAFGFKQIHYSARPAQVLTEDLPCRLIRRRDSIRFHGFVHEHPEEKQGEAIKYSTIRDDMQFLHGGYVDEATRRARFRRNLPLLMRDIKENPDRKINKFLYLRDIAQSLAFEHEQTGGVVLETQPERAKKGTEIWEKMLEDENSPTRMLIDSLQYYSLCVEVLSGGGGIEAEISLGCAVQGIPSLAARVQAKGRFLTRDHFFRLSNRIQQEATKHYESRYL